MDDILEPEKQAVSDNFCVPEKQNEQDFLSPQSEWGKISVEEVSYLEKKGMKTPAELLHSYRELEKAYSSRIAIPKDGDKEAFQKLYSRLGMPEDTTGFKLNFTIEDEAFGESFKQACLQNNILPQSAQALYDWYVENRTMQQTEEEQKWLEQSQAEMEEQQREWGAKAQRNTELMKRGIRLFSQDDEDAVVRMEEALGTKRMMQIFCRLGEAISEDNPISFGAIQNSDEKFDPVAFFREMFHD